MTDRERIYELSEAICKGCKTRHDCDTENCIMSEVVAEYLLENGYGDIKQIVKDILSEIEKTVFEYLHVNNLEQADKLSLLDSLLTYDIITDKTRELADRHDVELDGNV